MSVRATAKRQYMRMVDRAVEQIGSLQMPPEGWLTTMRKALGMSARQLARRAGVTKAAIYQAERQERERGITIRQLEKLADALEGRFIYAIVPAHGDISDRLRVQARAKAEGIVRRTSSHMALEKQSLTNAQIVQEIERLTNRLVHDMPSDFWDEP